MLKKKTRTEKGISDILKEKYDLDGISENYLDVAVDIYPTNYGNFCQITILMKKPFKKEESEDISKKVGSTKKTQDFLESLFPNYFEGGVSISKSTLEVYVEKHLPYYNSVKGYEDTIKITK